jgi:hypothetical protein
MTPDSVCTMHHFQYLLFHWKFALDRLICLYYFPEQFTLTFIYILHWMLTPLWKSNTLLQRVVNDLYRTRRFSSSYDLAPTTPMLDRRHTRRLRKRDNLLTGEGKGVGVMEEPNHTTASKPGPLQIIQYSLLYAYTFIQTYAARHGHRFVNFKGHFNPADTWSLFSVYFLQISSS